MKRSKKVSATHVNLALFLLILIVALNQFFIYKIGSNMNMIMPDIQKNEIQSSNITSLDSQGYQELLNYEKTITLTSEQNKQITGLNIELPCCGFQKIQASGNCACGHHLALYGLAKYMISNGYDRTQIQNEIDRWKLVFYPESGSENMGGC